MSTVPSLDFPDTTDVNKCQFCSKIFAHQLYLERHLNEKHGFKSFKKSRRNPVMCKLCNKSYSTPSNLTKHYRAVHGMKIGRHSCDLCPSEVFPTLPELRNHYVRLHNFKDTRHDLQFGSLQDFYNWKKEEEILSTAQFIRKTCPYTTKKGRKWLFRCHRSGKYKPTGTGQRQTRIQGTCKINATCLASMQVIEDWNGLVSVIYHNNHYGHTRDIAHLLSKGSVKSAIIKKLAQGAAIQDIVEDIGGSVSGSSEIDDEKTKESEFLLKKVKFIRRRMRAKKKTSCNKQEVISVAESFLGHVKAKKLNRETCETLKNTLSNLLEIVQDVKRND